MILSNYVSFQELSELRTKGPKYFRNIQVDESNLSYWQGLIVPVSIELVWTALKEIQSFNIDDTHLSPQSKNLCFVQGLFAL